MIKRGFWTMLCAINWTILGSQAGVSDDWHVEGDPKVIGQDIQFTNGDARLAGTVYLPENGGDRLPAVVALHGASGPTRQAGIFRRLREGLPPMVSLCSSMIVGEVVVPPAI